MYYTPAIQLYPAITNIHCTLHYPLSIIQEYNVILARVVFLSTIFVIVFSMQMKFTYNYVIEKLSCIGMKKQTITEQNYQTIIQDE